MINLLSGEELKGQTQLEKYGVMVLKVSNLPR
jgi:hypothetical protein